MFRTNSSYMHNNPSARSNKTSSSPRGGDHHQQEEEIGSAANSSRESTWCKDYIDDNDNRRRRGGDGDHSHHRRQQQQQHHEEEEDKEENRIRVIAPAALQEGYTFDVLVRGKPMTVTVPEGGVDEGEEFLIPIPPAAPTFDETEDEDNDDDHRPPFNVASSLSETMRGRYNAEDDDDNNTNNNKHYYDGGGGGMTVVVGPKWRHPLCGCCDVLTQATFWMGFLCTPILIAQLLTRLKLNWKGQKDTDDDEEISLSFNRIVISAIVVLLLGYIPVVGAFLMLLYWIGVVVYIGKNVRQMMRRKYNIKASTTECLDDCLCMCLCGCCSTIQMARQTHNDKEYPGYCCTTTGLEPNAPTAAVIV